jgi:hypothetical protein
MLYNMSSEGRGVKGKGKGVDMIEKHRHGDRSCYFLLMTERNAERMDKGRTRE